jgi:hypothetical protein
MLCHAKLAQHLKAAASARAIHKPFTDIGSLSVQAIEVPPKQYN